MGEIGFVIVDPGHFHAALVQKEMYANVSPQVKVYAPLGLDLIDYLSRIARFNSRAEAPTGWHLDIHAGPDFLRQLRSTTTPGGTVAIFSGRNRGKIERIRMAIEAGMHVLADKPVIIRREDLPALEAALDLAEQKGLVFRDLMTGRDDIVGAVLRNLVQDRDIIGDVKSVTATSVHHLLKEVAGVPNLRPAWYFDITEQGEGIADIGTHLVDRVHGVLFPGEALDYRRDIAFQKASRSPTMLSLAQFRQVTGETAWPAFLRPWLNGDTFEYFCNMRVHYEVRGVSVALEVRWDWQAPPGGDDTHTASYQGTRARIELRQGAAQGYLPEIFVISEADIASALKARIDALATDYRGIAVERQGGEWRVEIPAALRLGHDSRFVQFTRSFLDAVAAPASTPPWEKPNMVTKYYVCTEAVAVASGEPAG